jgi:hypothetical protein
MTATTPVERVAGILEAASYRCIQTPLSLAGMHFDFPAAFIGTGTSPDLILVADTAFDTAQRILQRVEGVARALDVMASRRPLTTILTGPRPRAEIMNTMSRVCRVLAIGVPDQDDQDDNIRNWLAVLLPLELPEPGESAVDSIGNLTGPDDTDPVTTALIDASREGAEEVERRLTTLVSEPLDKIATEDEP